MAERKFLFDGEMHSYDPDPPGCFQKILGVIIWIVIIVFAVKACFGS